MITRALAIAWLSAVIAHLGHAAELRDLVQNDTTVTVTEQHLTTIRKLAELFSLGVIQRIRFCYIPASSRIQAIVTHEETLDSGLVVERNLTVWYDDKTLAPRGCRKKEHNDALVTLNGRQYKVVTNLPTAQSVQETVTLFFAGEKSFKNEDARSSFLKLQLNPPTALNYCKEESVYEISLPQGDHDNETVWFKVQGSRITITVIGLLIY